MITDSRLIEIIKSKNHIYAKLQSFEKIRNIRYKINAVAGGRSPKRDKNASGQQKKIWETSKIYSDTSKLYRRNRCHLGLRTRIAGNSKGSLPKEINFLTSDEINAADRVSIESYLTPSRSIRKCCLTVFTSCAKLASRSLGCFKNCSKYSYSCKPIALSVKELSKNTHAGTDTLGRKDDIKVQSRVIKQIRDVFRKPKSYDFFYKSQSIIITNSLMNIFSLPELIFHRFQATYDDVKKICNEKSRIVWAVPYFIISIENIFFGSIIDSTKQNAVTSEVAIYPIGLTNYEIGQKSVKTLRNDFRIIGTKSGYKIYSLDFSKFDTNIPNWAKDIFFALHAQVITMQEQQTKIYDYLRLYFKYTPFIYKDELLYKERGISSGLLITNLFDTWWNLTIHYFVQMIKEVFPEVKDEIFSEKTSFDKLYLDKQRIRNDILITDPLVRVMGDDAILLCDEYTLELHRVICKMVGLTVKIKHVCNSPDDDIFFLGRYWNTNNRPFQTEEYMALRIVYTKWYDEKKIPFSLKDLHLYRMLSICLPLIGGKEFLDKYLFDYKPYRDFKTSQKGFIYMKEFIEEQFKFYSYEDAFDVDSY